MNQSLKVVVKTTEFLTERLLPWCPLSPVMNLKEQMSLDSSMLGYTEKLERIDSVIREHDRFASFQHQGSTKSSITEFI